jgi:hypothetical protein
MEAISVPEESIAEEMLSGRQSEMNRTGESKRMKSKERKT